MSNRARIADTATAQVLIDAAEMFLDDCRKGEISEHSLAALVEAVERAHLTLVALPERGSPASAAIESIFSGIVADSAKVGQ